MSYGWYYSKPKKAKKKSRDEEPRKRMKFGQTWWGEQWLNALSKIDFDNRLPRGRSYAGNGSVRNIEITGRTITAKVQGSRPSPYKIKITVPGFTKTQQEELLTAISGNPLILAQLLNREIPQELFRLATDKNIRIFPSSWKDLTMDCSCPDWAVPCKHLAAVIYLMANEIDVNPFVLFNLRGLDLVSDLKRYHAGIDSHAVEQIPVLESFLTEKLEEKDAAPDFSMAATPDFSLITPQTDKIFTLLTSGPLFYSSDFKPILHTAYTTAAKRMKKEEPLRTRPKIDELIRRITIFEDTMILLDQNLMVEDVCMTLKEKKKTVEERIAWDEFVEMLDALDPATVENCNDALRGIVLHRQFARALACHGAFIPQLLVNRDKNHLIRYIPAENDPQISSLCQAMRGYADPGTIWIWHKPTKGEERYFPVNTAENSRMMISVFLQTTVSWVHYESKFYGKENDPVLGLFFWNKPQPFNGLTDKQIPNTIQLWLKRLVRGVQRWQPLISVAEKNGEFLLDVAAVDTENATSEPVPMKTFLVNEDFHKVRLEFLRDLSTLTGFLPDLAYYIKISGRQPMKFLSNDFIDVLQRILPTLRMLGIEILMPRALEKLLIPKPSLRLTVKASGKIVSFINLHEMIGFDYQVAIGDQLISIEEFRKLVKGLSGIVRIKDQYVLLNSADLEKILKAAETPVELSPQQLLKAALAGEYEGAAIGLDPGAGKLIKKLTSPEKIALPSGINANLRPYQLTGYRWMVQQSKIGFGSLIADDMGLGKTLQVIALLVKFKQESKLDKAKALVIVPTTLLTNWCKEIEKFAPSLRTAVYHGTGRKLGLSDTDILITTYGMVRSDLKTLKSNSWYVVVIDEAQNIKNTDTDQTKAVKSIKSTVRVAMSGTPVENRLSEYWSIMDFVFPGYLGSAKAFAAEFADPIQIYHDKEAAGRFRKITAPFILRRLKTDKTIISDLPEKIETNSYCSLTREQAGLYQNVVDHALESISESEGIQRKGLVLKMITALKQICNHPDNFLKKGKADPALSGKSVMLMELLETIREAGEKTLIFTQYREMGDILVPMIERQFGTTPLFLHGGTTRKNRDELVEEFQNQRNRWVFVLSLKAGGTGLNLTAAGHVIHHDFWWNPAVEAQATDRAYRIGQHQNVMVNRLLTQGTFEEKIDEMLKNKKELANLTVASGENWIGNLSDKELKALFRLG